MFWYASMLPGGGRQDHRQEHPDQTASCFFLRGERARGSGEERTRGEWKRAATRAPHEKRYALKERMRGVLREISTRGE